MSIIVKIYGCKQVFFLHMSIQTNFYWGASLFLPRKGYGCEKVDNR